MAITLKIDPVTRIEGHLKIEVTLDNNTNNKLEVYDAKSSGTMFRGLEKILINHDPYDAPHFTQRICGVCPVSHGMASCMTLEDAFGASVTDNGRILRNLVLGSNFIQSHILHFYHLAALDYINTVGLLDMAPWSSRYITQDMATGEIAAALVDHYKQALAIRRKAHQMGAIFGGKLPCASTFVPGGCTEQVTNAKIDEFSTLLGEVKNFIDTVHVPDIQLLAQLFPQYLNIGCGCGNLLAYGVFELDTNGNNKLLSGGRYTNGSSQAIDISKITEDVNHSWYSSASGLNPAIGETEPDAAKSDAYSWIKSPRYDGTVHETGPLARMWVNGLYTDGISTIDRIAARAYEAQYIADNMQSWLNQLTPADPAYTQATVPGTAAGIGLTEAPRGALGHWVDITSSKISRYQLITPTAWNASPKDDANNNGPMEQALIGTEINDLDNPIELLRIIHSFDPCLACSVHMLRPGKKQAVKIIPVNSGL